MTRATPAVLDVLGPILGDELVRLGLAAALWFVLVVSLVEQLRRQLAALGIGRYRPTYWRSLSPEVPSPRFLAAVLAVLVVGAAVSALTLDPALQTAVALVRVVGTLDVAAVDPGAFAVVVAFFVAYGAATWAADRLLIGGIRTLRDA